MALSNIFGKFRKPTLGAGQPGRVGLPKNQPPGWATPSKPPTAHPSSGAGAGAGAGGQGSVVQPPTGPDTSWQDSTYNTTVSGIKTGLTNLSGYLSGAEDSLGADYGIQFDRDPNNPLQGSNFRIDPNVDVTNPFSRAALLNRTHKQNMAGNTNGMAARGQLYAGSLQNAQDAEGFGYQSGQNTLRSEFATKFGGLYGKWLDANQTGTQQGIDAQGAAIGRHANDPAPDKGVNTGGAAAPGTNPNQYPNSSVGGKQPSERVSQAVKDYLAQQKTGKPGRSKPPRKGAGKTGGARAPGGK